MSTPLEKTQLQQIINLQENASAFFEKVINNNNSEMKCGKGCTACCYTSLTVFPVEAARITEYFETLPDLQKENFKQKLNLPKESGTNLLGKQVKPCSFLHEGECLIYPVRPIICRTHGIPLKRLQQDKILIDLCPLNFQEELPQQEDWLDQDRLNLLLALAQKNYASNLTSSLKNYEDANGRIPLNLLKESFL